MKSKMLLSFAALTCLAVGPTVSFANQDDMEKKSDKMRMMTGCLQAGDKSGEYNLMADDGSTWELHSKGAKLGEHVGHTVTVHGSVWHNKMHGAKEKTKEEMSPSSNEHGHLNVSSVTMVSESCKK